MNIPTPATIAQLQGEIKRLKVDLDRYANPWTVEIRNISGQWHQFAHDAPITLQQAEERIEVLQSENPDATFRAVPWLNSSQAQLMMRLNREDWDDWGRKVGEEIDRVVGMARQLVGGWRATSTDAEWGEFDRKVENELMNLHHAGLRMKVNRNDM